MTLDQAVAFVIFSVVAAGTPGPSNALLTATGANVGVLRGLPCLLGVTVGMGFMMLVVAFGLGRVILDHPRVLETVRWCGAAALCWLAWKIATARRAGPAPDGKPVGFGVALALQWINPKSWLVCASAAATFLHEGAGSALTQSAAFGLLFVAAALPSCFPWLAFGAFLQRFLQSERPLRLFNGVMGALLAASMFLLFR